MANPTVATIMPRQAPNARTNTDATSGYPGRVLKICTYRSAMPDWS